MSYNITFDITTLPQHLISELTDVIDAIDRNCFSDTFRRYRTENTLEIHLTDHGIRVLDPGYHQWGRRDGSMICLWYKCQTCNWDLDDGFAEDYLLDPLNRCFNCRECHKCGVGLYDVPWFSESKGRCIDCNHGYHPNQIN